MNYKVVALPHNWITKTASGAVIAASEVLAEGGRVFGISRYPFRDYRDGLMWGEGGRAGSMMLEKVERDS